MCTPALVTVTMALSLVSRISNLWLRNESADPSDAVRQGGRVRPYQAIRLEESRQRLRMTRRFAGLWRTGTAPPNTREFDDRSLFRHLLLGGNPVPTAHRASPLQCCKNRPRQPDFCRGRAEATEERSATTIDSQPGHMQVARSASLELSQLCSSPATEERRGIVRTIKTAIRFSQSTGSDIAATSSVLP